MEPPSSGSTRTPGEHRLKAAFFTVANLPLSVIDTLRTGAGEQHVPCE
ncbi:hypothetical protein [Deinococcus cavernae]|nr:hypothetical protein [Deinococcus cavernae]